MKWLLSLLLVSGIGSDTISENFGSIGKRNKPSTQSEFVIIDDLPYELTTVVGSYLLTGTFSGSTPTWSADPSGETGSCTDFGSGIFKCAVDINPDEVGEGVEVITVANEASDSVTLGYYVTDTDGDTVSDLHTALRSQDIDGLYNQGLLDDSYITDLINAGTSGLDLTQSVEANKPKLKLNIVNGQPVIRCDGNDIISGITGNDWIFLNNGSDFTVEYVFATSSSNPNSFQSIVTTASSLGSSGNRGLSLFHDDRVSSSREDRAMFFLSSGTSLNLQIQSINDAAPSGIFNTITVLLDDDSGAGIDGTQICNGTVCGTANRSSTYSSLAPTSPLSICGTTSGAGALTGDIFTVLIYNKALSSTQLNINEAVNEWAFGSSFPVTP